jgi:hypothetical protein
MVTLNFLEPISQELLALVLEDWNIWLRWNESFRKDLATIDTHPALPVDRSRHEELKSEIGDRLQVDRTSSVRAKADFRNVDSDGKSTGTQVKWVVLEAERG